MLTGWGVGTPQQTPFPPTSGCLLYLPGVCVRSHRLQRKGTPPMCSWDPGTHPAGNALASLELSLGGPVARTFGPKKLGQEEALFLSAARSSKGPGVRFFPHNPSLTGPDHLAVEMSSQAHFAPGHLRFLSDLSHGCTHPTAEPEAPKITLAQLCSLRTGPVPTTTLHISFPARAWPWKLSIHTAHTHRIPTPAWKRERSCSRILSSKRLLRVWQP